MTRDKTALATAVAVVTLLGMTALAAHERSALSRMDAVSNLEPTTRTVAFGGAAGELGCCDHAPAQREVRLVAAHRTLCPYQEGTTADGCPLRRDSAAGGCPYSGRSLDRDSRGVEPAFRRTVVPPPASNPVLVASR
jgi:hypothetical protein